MAHLFPTSFKNTQNQNGCTDERSEVAPTSGARLHRRAERGCTDERSEVAPMSGARLHRRAERGCTDERSEASKTTQNVDTDKDVCENKKTKHSAVGKNQNHNCNVSKKYVNIEETIRKFSEERKDDINYSYPKEDFYLEKNIKTKLNYKYAGCIFHSLLHKEKLQTIESFFSTNYDYNDFDTNIWVISFTFNYYNKQNDKKYNAHKYHNISKILIHSNILNFNQLIIKVLCQQITEHLTLLPIFRFIWDNKDEIVSLNNFLLSFYDTCMCIIPDTEDSILDELETMFNITNNIEEKRNIVDVIWRKQPERGLILLNQLRRIDNQNQNIGKRHNNVYTDSQNVHNTDINQSCLFVALNLIEKYWRPCDNDELMLEIYKSTKITLQQLEDIFNNVTRFNTNNIFDNEQKIKSSKHHIDTFTLNMLFISVWNFIQISNNKLILISRLEEEIIDGFNYCSTGKLGRLCSVIQGFTNNTDFIINIGVNDEIQAILTHKFNKKFQEKEIDPSDDDTMCKTLDIINEIVIEYITQTIQTTQTPEYGERLNEIKTKIIPIVEQYIGKQILFNNTIVLNDLS